MAGNTQFDVKSRKQIDLDIKKSLVEYGYDLVAIITKRLINQYGLKGGKGSMIDSLEISVDKKYNMTLKGNSYINTFLYGRRPNTGEPPSVRAIEEWLKRYKSRLNFKWTLRRTKGKIHITYLAYLISKKIYRDGIIGRDFLTPAIKIWQKELETEIGRDMSRYIDRNFNYVFKK